MAQCLISGSVSTLLGGAVTDAVVTVSVSTPFFTLDGELISGQIGQTTTNTSGDFSISVVRTTTLGKLVQFDINYNTGSGSRRSKKYLLYVPETDTANFASMVASTYVPAPNNLFPASSVTVQAISGLAASTVQAALAEHQGDITALEASSGLSSAHIAASSGVHGVTGSVVGTTDTQVLTNKTITGTFTGPLTGNADTATLASTVTTNANLTGDVTSSGNATTLATVNSNVGSFGSASASPSVTVNAKGLVTAASSTSIQIAESQVTNLVSDLALKAPLASPTFTGTVTAPTFSGALSGNATTATSATTASTVTTNANLTGGVTSVGNAATVVTNANLTGDVTSVGNATTLTNAPVIAKVLTGYTSGAGTVSATDSILSAIQKLNGNDATNANLTGPITSVGNATSITNASIDLTTKVTGALPIANGGTASTTRAAAIAALLPSQAATTGYVLTSVNGAGGDPLWSQVALASSVSGVLPTANGGTNLSTYTTGDIPYASATNVLSKLAVGSANQIIKSVGGVPTWAAAPTGGINYISSNYDAEVDTTGWTTYADAAQNTPVDATGGSPSSTWTRSTSSPLRGTASFLWTRTAANRQGEGVAYAFTLDAADKAKPIGISFDYAIASGTFFAADGTTAPLNDGTTSQNAGMSDLEVFLYDVTNSALIPVSGQVLTSSSSTSATYRGTAQTSATGTSYRLVIHTARSTAVAFTAQFDNFYVGPQVMAFGPAISDWNTYTPTGGWVSNTTYTGKWRRVGDSMEVLARAALTGAPTSADFSVAIPTGYTIDTAKLNSTSGGFAMSLGSAGMLVAGARYYGGNVTYASTTAVSIVNTESGNTGVTNATNPATFANGDIVSVSFRVPISGWSSNSVMSADSDTRVISWTGSQTSEAVTGGSTNIAFTSTLDRTGSWNGTVFTVPVSGDYYAAGSYVNSAASAWTVYKNGSLFGYGGTNTAANTGAGGLLIPGCVPGDTISLRTSGTGTITLGKFGIFRLSGPAVVAATESVTFQAGGAAPTGTLAAGHNTVIYGTKEADSHNAYNNTTGIYTVPVAGTYRITAGWGASCASSALGNASVISIAINGTRKRAEKRVAYANSTISISYSISSEYKCVAGDTINITSYTEVTTPAYNNGDNMNYFTVSRVGN